MNQPACPPAVGEVCVGLCCSAYMPSQFRLFVCHTGGSVKSPVNVVSRDIRVMQIFAAFPEIWGVKEESGRISMISLHNAVARLP